MDEPIKQIGERLKGLRDVLDIPAEEIAQLCNISIEEYLKMENGDGDISISKLQTISKRYGIALDVLMFGEEPRMSSYFLTRKDQGMSVERRQAYKYQSLASGFRGRNADPFMVLVEPKPEGSIIEQNSHEGQEFDFVTEGRLELTIKNKTLILNQGDSIYFDSSLPHCMRALDDKAVRFLAVIL
ncbi:helix-turn-helix domain-containing protein [Xylanibacter oryzae]|uniref:helix-turn-helix domain-containing protein n=1 Tax=Xylanibacter oryzae TaxID=185293 RepID=UPI0004AE8BFD|nr:cupin domain-containing protein [Xylanibacter oryzae]